MVDWVSDVHFSGDGGDQDDRANETMRARERGDQFILSQGKHKKSALLNIVVVERQNGERSNSVNDKHIYYYSGIRIFASDGFKHQNLMDGFYLLYFTKVPLIFASDGILHQICWDQSDANIRIPLCTT